MKNKPRDKIVTIEKLYDEPKLLKEGVGDKANFYSFGIKLSDGSYANINVGANDVEEAKAKAEPKFIVNPQTKERIEEGKEYKLYEESTDEAEKYWRVTAFVNMDDVAFKDPEIANKSDAELARQAPKESMKDVVHKESGGASGGTPTPYERTQLLIVRQNALTNATQAVTAIYTWKAQAGEKFTVEDVEKEIKKLQKEFAKLVAE